MPSKQRPNGQLHSNNHTKPIIYKLGIYGWRKRCLYFLILLIAIIAIINLGLIVWIIRVQDFGLHGMGRLHITSNGIKMDGVAEFVSVLRAKTIMSRTNSPIQINSRKNLSLSALDSKGNVVGQITMDSNKIILKNKKLYVQDQKGRTLLYADDKKIKLDIQNMHITVPGGLNLEDSVQTSLVEANGDGEGLKLESLTKKLFMNAAGGIGINSWGSSVKFTSHNNMEFVSKKGKIVLDASNIQLNNLPQSSVPGKSNGKVYGEIAEVCMCKDGSLFLAPPDSQLPCKVTNGVCV